MLYLVVGHIFEEYVDRVRKSYQTVNLGILLNLLG
jgi:hypothetical protein